MGVSSGLTDIQSTTTVTTLDALGSLKTSRFWGYENGLPIGFPSDVGAFVPPATVEEAVAAEEPILVAQYAVYNRHSWMPLLEPVANATNNPLWQELCTKRVIVQNRLCGLAWQ